MEVRTHYHPRGGMAGLSRKQIALSNTRGTSNRDGVFRSRSAPEPSLARRTAQLKRC